jgi:hypothetical protein
MNHTSYQDLLAKDFNDETLLINGCQFLLIFFFSFQNDNFLDRRYKTFILKKHHIYK